MTLPIRRHRPVADGRRGMWARDPLWEFDEFFNQMGSLLQSEGRMAWAPLADLTETDDAYVLEAELPGVGREDVDVQIGRRELTISGEMREQGPDGILHRRTRRTGRFEFQTALPGPVDGDTATARLNDGVLTVRLPKATDAGVTHVEIQPGE
ncbi:Hsp20/alpha crystallin family protein [Streptomyces sp. B6B3]|uniref:Hsp20/alpha crystallin family protein n=1 Tax=Streptomyces sp. B6B3 TaxID=3153570 RepID=UPI00325F397D